MEHIVIVCLEHGKFVIICAASFLPADRVCCPLCWSQDKLKTQ